MNLTADMTTTIIAFVAVAALVWKLHSDLQNKIDNLSKSHHELSGDFKELRGEIRAKFGLADLELVSKAVESIKSQLTKDRE